MHKEAFLKLLASKISCYMVYAINLASNQLIGGAEHSNRLLYIMMTYCYYVIIWSNANTIYFLDEVTISTEHASTTIITAVNHTIVYSNIAWIYRGLYYVFWSQI